MEQVTRRTVLALAMPAALFALAGCGTTVTSAPGGDVNAADLEFVTQAYNIITFDHEECSLAPTYAHTPAVKEIAARLLNRANAFAAKLDPIVKAQGIKPPTELRTDLRVRLYHIHLDRGLDFDRSFIDDQIASHVEALDRQEILLGTPGQNPQLLALAKEGTDELRQSLAALRTIQRQLPPPSAPTGPFGLPPPPGISY
jgi:predicted outer membrane protein